MARPLPSAQRSEKQLPEVTEVNKELPVVNETVKQLPNEGDDSNAVVIDGERIIIKPTKLKYQRDRTAVFYRIVDIYPLPDILAMEAGVIDPDRDGDKCLFDWLIAVFDDAKFVKKHYDSMDSQIINKCLEIFKRINGINDKEEQAKNRATKENRA